MKRTIKALKTAYGGFRFRSRTEARWALFFDELGVSWDYEPQGFDLGTHLGFYLPDFFLPGLKSWVEIKGVSPNDREELRAWALAKGTEQKVYIFAGPMPIPDPEYPDTPLGCAYDLYHPDTGPESDHFFCQCPVCGKIGIQYHGYSERLCSCFSGLLGRPDPQRTIKKAATTAKFHRFGRKKRY